MADDFSTTTNPSGPWSYGWKSTVGGAFTLNSNLYAATLQNGAQVVGWYRFPGSESGVTKNISPFTGVHVTGNPVSGMATSTIPAGGVYVYAGQNGASDNFGAVRFTVPANGAGLYQVRSRGYSIYVGPIAGDTDFHVVINGSEVFGQGIPASTGAVTNRSGYTNTLALAAGDTVDFLVGRGADNDLSASGANVELVLELVSTNPITAAQAMQKLIDKINQAGLTQNTQPLIATLEAAIASFDRGDFIPGVNKLEAFQNQVRAQVAPENPALAAMLLSMAQQIIEVVMVPRGRGKGLPPSGATRMEFIDIVHEPNGRVRLHFPGGRDQVYLIQASTNLIDWETIGTAQHVENGHFEFKNTHTSAHPQRFYRVVMP